MGTAEGRVVKKVVSIPEKPLRGVSGVKESPNKLKEAHEGQGLNNIGNLRPVQEDKVSKGQTPESSQ